MSEEPRLPAGARRRIVVVAPDAAILMRQRMPLLRMIAAGGHKLLCLVGIADEKATSALAAVGAEVETFDLGPPQLRAYADRRMFDSIAERLKTWKPYAVLGIGLKPMVAAALASRRVAGARIVLVASSLEPLADGGSERPGLAVRWLLRRALRSAHAIVVNNDEQRARLRALSVLPHHLSPIVQPGSGVDLVAYAHLPMPDLAGGPGFALLARPDRPTDIAHLGEAVRLVKARSLPARFVYCPLPASTGGTMSDVAASSHPEGIELTDSSTDIRAVMARCHVLVQMSDAEGLAHETVEAIACGRPVITIDVAGCREAIDERVNGVVVPPRDPSAMARAIESFLRRPDQLEWMSRASRRKAEGRFDANTISMELLGLMGLTARS